MKTYYVVLLCMCAMCQQCAEDYSRKDSWAAYCEKYGVDPDNPTEEQENTYLDAYAGSTEEEADLNR